MLNRDHFAADIAVLWTELRWLETRARCRSEELEMTLNDLQVAIDKAQQTAQKWRDREAAENRARGFHLRY